MTLRVTKDPQNDRQFWIYNPLGGRGRWCTVGLDGILRDKEHTMFLTPSPEHYQAAYKAYIA